jgi:hypothetical protein
MIATRRRQNSYSRPPSAFTQTPSPTSPNPSQGHSRKTSLTNMKANPMNWIQRSATSSSRDSFGQTPRPIISEPQSTNYNALDITVPRKGKLGTGKKCSYRDSSTYIEYALPGATVVRTPEDALREEFITEDGRCIPSPTKELPPSPVTPPPATPILTSRSSPSLPLRELQEAKPAPTGPLPPTPSASTITRLRPSIKPRGSSPPSSGEFCPPIPMLPPHVTTSPPQPPFEAILLSGAPTRDVDPKKTIVTIDTSTTTYKTTLSTLMSAESHLSRYLDSILTNGEDDVIESNADDAASVYSNISENGFDSIFQRHLASTGVIPKSMPKSQVAGIHLFLDRPGAPYVPLSIPLASV